MKLDVFMRNQTLLNPSRDWLVLVHGLGNDARNIALTRKFRCGKGFRSWWYIANEFCDIIENRIWDQHSISVSCIHAAPKSGFSKRSQEWQTPTMYEKWSMSQLLRGCMRIRGYLDKQDKPSLGWWWTSTEWTWWKQMDITWQQGIGVMINNWTEHIKKKMRDTNYNPESPSMFNHHHN